MDERKIEALEQELDLLRAKDARVDLKPMLHKALSMAEDNDERLFILSRLTSEWKLDLAGVPFNDVHRAKFEAAETVIRQCIELQPSDPYPWIQLAEHFHYFAPDLPKALGVIDEAIKRAESTRAFVRQAHGVRIRIGLESKDYGVVRKSMEALLTHTPNPTLPDVGLEQDFLTKIPPGVIPTELIAKYNALLQKGQNSH